VARGRVEVFSVDLGLHDNFMFLFVHLYRQVGSGSLDGTGKNPRGSKRESGSDTYNTFLHFCFLLRKLDRNGHDSSVFAPRNFAVSIYSRFTQKALLSGEAQTWQITCLSAV
jgi:hypothetical protein